MPSLLETDLCKQQVCNMAPQYDVAVIGGGVVGCGILHDLTLQGYSSVLLEKNPHLLMGSSSGNSGLLASGFDTDRQSLEGQCLAQAAGLTRQVSTKYGIPSGTPGAIMIALTTQELQKLPGIVKESEESVRGCRLLTTSEIHKMEPHLTGDILGGVWVPGEVAIEPWFLPTTLVHAACRVGAQVFTDCEVISGKLFADSTWELATTRGPVTARLVVNAGGLYGDMVEKINQKSNFKIRPRKGEFAIYGKDASRYVKHIIMPVPTETSRGILIFPTVYKNVVIGPTAKDCDERSMPEVDRATVSSLTSYAEKVVPALKQERIIGTYAGLRPATESKDYHIYPQPNRNWVTVGGIRSTGLSACLAIAKYVRSLVEANFSVLPSRVGHAGSDRAPTWWIRDKETVVMDGVEYHVTHPVTRVGLELREIGLGLKPKL